MVLDSQSGTMVILGCRFGTRVGVEDTGSGACVRFVSSGPVKGLGSVATDSGTCVKFVGTGAGAWVRSEGAKTGTRLGFGSKLVIGAKVLPTSGVGTEVGLLGTLAVSKVLVRSRVSRVWVVLGLSEVLAVGVEGPDIEVMFGAGVVSRPSAGP